MAHSGSMDTQTAYIRQDYLLTIVTYQPNGVLDIQQICKKNDFCSEVLLN